MRMRMRMRMRMMMMMMMILELNMVGQAAFALSGTVRPCIGRICNNLRDVFCSRNSAGATSRSFVSLDVWQDASAFSMFRSTRWQRYYCDPCRSYCNSHYFWHQLLILLLLLLFLLLPWLIL